MQLNLQDKVDLKRLWKEQNQCCQSLVKWSAALVRLLSRSRQARWQMRGLWYSIFHTSGYQNFSASLPRFFLHYGWSNSSRDTDPSAASSLSYMFFMIVLMVFFPTGVFLYQTLETVLSMTVSKQRTAFLHFAWSLLQISFEQHDGAPFLIHCGKNFGFHAKSFLSRLSWAFEKS